MSNEIATYSMILSKLSLGKSGTECPTKTQILAINSLIVIENASTYGANECVKIDDIRKKAETWNYYLTVSPTSMSFPASGGSKQFTYSSYKRKVLDGVEQSGDISVSLKTSSASGTGFSISGTTVSASVNQTTSSRTGKVTLTQNESNKTATINLSQSADSISSYGEWVITVSANPTSVPNSGGTSTITASAKRAVHWASGKVTEETGNPTLSTNLGSLSSASSPSTLTLGQNTSTSSRTATIKATHGGKSATCTVTQAGAEPTIEYVFTISPWQVNVGASGGTGDIGFTSYKLVNGNQISLGYSIDSSTLPSWATYSNGRFTISSNSSTSSRAANVYFTQSESGKRDYATISQSGYVPPTPDTYVFVWTGDNSTADKTLNLPYTRMVGSYTVTSTKNGSNQSWSVSSSPSWISTTTSSNNLSYTASENTGSARSGKVVLTQSGSGKTLTINVSQDAKPADNYVFTWDDGTTTDQSMSLPYQGSSAASDFVVVSTKNGSSQSWSVSSKPSWVGTSTSGNTLNVTVDANSGSARNGTIVLTQSGSNKTLEINVSQAAKPVTYNIVFTYKLNDVVQQTLTWDIPTTSTTKTFSVPTPSGGWSSSDKISLSLQPSSPGIGWTGRTYELNNAPMKDTTDTLSIENKSSGITFNVVYSIEGAAVFTFADGSTFKKQYSISQGDTHTYKTGIQPIISTVFGEEAGYNIGSHTVGIEVKTSTDNSVSVIVSKNTTGQPRTLYQEWNQWKSGNTGKTIRFEVDQAA